MGSTLDRREFVRWAGATLVVKGFLEAPAAKGQAAASAGCVAGQPEVARVGAEVLASGGNAVDAAVAAALTAGVVAVNQCGIGGYGGHLVVALDGGKKVSAIDFNSTAAAAARPDMFPVNERGEVRDRINTFGWLAVGVPGTLAGLQLALDRWGSRPFRRLVQPAIRYAREGFPVSKGLAAAIRSARNQLQKDPASARLLLTAGEPPEPGRLFRNADLADLLETLARRGSVASFYRGDLGSRIAGAIRKHGGLVTAEDLAAYQAREVKPLRFDWRGFAVYTAPLTAGGLTVLQMLGVLKALGWETRPLDDPRTTHAFLEAQRVAWDDRLRWLGDPEKGTVPVERLLSDRHARETAARVDAAVKEGKPVPASAGGPTADGTIHLSVADRQGNLVALTLTHGGAFGAQVTVDGLGLILGHGMSRFEARPGHPNSPGPGKRPLHNMCPTVVLRDGKPILAVGGAGGRRIPNAICTMLAHYVGRGQPVADAVAAARLHTEGGLGITADKSWPEPHEQYLRRMGYDVRPGSVAVVHAVGLEPEAGTARAASR